jgi:hypothetical protein
MFRFQKRKNKILTLRINYLIYDEKLVGIPDKYAYLRHT